MGGTPRGRVECGDRAECETARSAIVVSRVPAIAVPRMSSIVVPRVPAIGLGLIWICLDSTCILVGFYLIPLGFYCFLLVFYLDRP